MNEPEEGWRELKSSTHNPNLQLVMASQPSISEPVPERAQAEAPAHGPGTQAAEEHKVRSRRRRH